MNFLRVPLPDDDDDSVDDEPGIMHIGGPRGRRVWEITWWLLAIFIIAGLMALLLIRFGATAVWAIGLVAFMLAYMAIMARWAGKDH